MAIQLMIFIGGENLALSMLCNVTPPVCLLFFTIQIFIAQLENLNSQAALKYGPGLFLSCELKIHLNIFN